MRKISDRHKLVKRLVVSSLAIASIFGINSFFFSFSQNRLSYSIKRNEALDAILTSTITDQISTISELNRTYLLCQSDFPKACENHFTALSNNICRNLRSKEKRSFVLPTFFGL